MFSHDEDCFIYPGPHDVPFMAAVMDVRDKYRIAEGRDCTKEFETEYDCKVSIHNPAPKYLIKFKTPEQKLMFLVKYS